MQPKSELLEALEWLEAESSASEGQASPAIETIRRILEERISAEEKEGSQ